MSNTNRTILILGSGPGIGVGVAAHFASKGFTHVALVARNAQRLENEDAASVREAAPKTVVKTYAADLSDYEGVPKLLEKIVADAGIPEVVVYNASHLTKGEVGVYEANDVEVDLRVSSPSSKAQRRQQTYSHIPNRSQPSPSTRPPTSSCPSWPTSPAQTPKQSQPS